MNIKDQVCSLELSKRLNELGVKQESLFSWHYDNGKHYPAIGNPSLCWCPFKNVSAFTSGELGEMLPDFSESINRTQGDWVCIIRDQHDDINHHSFGKTEADARAQMLIYLIENNLIPNLKEIKPCHTN